MLNVSGKTTLYGILTKKDYELERSKKTRRNLRCCSHTEVSVMELTERNRLTMFARLESKKERIMPDQMKHVEPRRLFSGYYLDRQTGTCRRALTLFLFVCRQLRL